MLKFGEINLMNVEKLELILVDMEQAWLNGGIEYPNRSRDE